VRILLQPFERCLGYVLETVVLVDLSVQGILRFQGEDRVTEARLNLRRFRSPDIPEEDLAREMARAKEVAEFAREQAARGFDLLYAHAIVGLWGALETAVMDFFVRFLLHSPQALNNDIVQKVRIPLAEFEMLEREDRMRVVVDELERALRSQYKSGIERFEGLFANFGLSSEVSPEVRKTLFEMFHIRNVIAHRNLIAERRLVAACPWLPYRPGETIKLPLNRFLDYYEALSKYLEVLSGRVNRFLQIEELACKPASAADD
jgi:hypothetical protein